MDDIRYVMVIDQRRCIGCHSCAIACKSENNMPNGAMMSLNTVITEGGDYTDLPSGAALTEECDMATFERRPGTVRLDYLTRSCQQCKDAPCVSICPSGASKVMEGGIVYVDTQFCIGCMWCMDACPYDRMRVYMADPEFTTNINFGDQRIAPSFEKTVKKCTFCAHKDLTGGEKPFCVETCPARARYFGNINDPSSEVYRLVHDSTRRIRQPFMTKPGYEKPESAVYFIEP